MTSRWADELGFATYLARRYAPAKTRAFLDRRIEGVMKFEKAKAQLLGNREQVRLRSDVQTHTSPLTIQVDSTRNVQKATCEKEAATGTSRLSASSRRGVRLRYGIW